MAAVLERDGLVLICRRKAGQHYAGKWEFPGGKVEPGEGLPEALRRELMEELGIAASIGTELTRYAYEYPGRPAILLVFYRVNEFFGEPKNLVFDEIRWERAGRFTDYDFLDGDLDFIKKLASPAIGS